jgi:hypothetical protein
MEIKIKDKSKNAKGKGNQQPAFAKASAGKAGKASKEQV